MFKTSLRFFENQRLAFFISLLLTSIAVIAIISRGLVFGIELKGGSLFEVKTSQKVTEEEVEEAFSHAGITEMQIRIVEGDSATYNYIVSVPSLDPTQGTLAATFVAQELEITPSAIQVALIGPEWASDTVRTLGVITVVSLLLTAVYVALRFDVGAAGVALATLLHNAIVIIGLYALTGRPIIPQVIAALLAILGYSLYDTVIAFRHLQNALTDGTSGTASFAEVADRAINELVPRSLMLLFAALIPFLGILIVSSGPLEDFAITMSLGIVVGTYSSLALAAPFYALWKRRTAARKNGTQG